MTAHISNPAATVTAASYAVPVVTFHHPVPFIASSQSFRSLAGIHAPLRQVLLALLDNHHEHAHLQRCGLDRLLQLAAHAGFKLEVSLSKHN